MMIATRNLATQIGIYNGATGIVVGFGFHTAILMKKYRLYRL